MDIFSPLGARWGDADAAVRQEEGFRVRGSGKEVRMQRSEVRGSRTAVWREQRAEVRGQGTAEGRGRGQDIGDI